MMDRTMGTRGGRSPVRVGNLLTAAVPALAERMLEQAVRREWTETVGPEASRRTRPGALRQGTLEVSVDNSPWLQASSLKRILTKDLLARGGRRAPAASEQS